jgi:UDP-glucuronate decarboxylase
MAPRIHLVTGGAGFLGFNLCKRLLARGDRVICLDDLSSGSREHVDQLSEDGRFRFIHHDVVVPIDVRADYIFNLACPASPAFYQANPIKTTLTSVLGVQNMLELARASGARMLQASTSEVYGDPSVHPQIETYRGNVASLGPRACYNEGKRCAEALIYDHHRTHGVDCRIARIFNTYGPAMREDDGRVVSNFIVAALQGRDLTVYGDGSQTRSMCYVDDLVEGLLRLMDAEVPAARPFNLGNPSEISVVEIARRVIDATGSRSRIVHLAAPEDDPRVRCPDITRARTELGWAPRIALEDGLRLTIDHYSDALDRSVRPGRAHGRVAAKRRQGRPHPAL